MWHVSVLLTVIAGTFLPFLRISEDGTAQNPDQKISLRKELPSADLVENCAPLISGPAALEIKKDGSLNFSFKMNEWICQNADEGKDIGNVNQTAQTGDETEISQEGPWSTSKITDCPLFHPFLAPILEQGGHLTLEETSNEPRAVQLSLELRASRSRSLSSVKNSGWNNASEGLSFLIRQMLEGCTIIEEEQVAVRVLPALYGNDNLIIGKAD